MSEDLGDVAGLFGQIASEQHPIQRVAGTRRLQPVQLVKRRLATRSPGDFRRAVARRHAAVEVGV